MPAETRHAPELLAPAGGPDALRAAVANGADAVYLGVGRFNARRSAENFTHETLVEACEFAHLRGVSVYLTVNVVVLPTEMDDVLTEVDRAWAAGVDAVIVQDLGLMRCLRDALPHVRVHASTQMNAHSPSTLRALAARGVRRTTLARETSVHEIALLADAAATCGMEVESFVHGAICVCYSGQCLLSSMIGGRSANRGRCAQPCRMTYRLVDEQGESRAEVGSHLLSPKDLAGITMLAGLVRSGVSSLKIEGRMKSAEYVALVTGVYRAALDRAAADPEHYSVSQGEISVLEEAFSRGLSEAYLAGERGNEMMSYRRPNNRGVPVGRVGSVSGREAVLHLDKALESEDTIEVWTTRGRFAQTVGEMHHAGRRVSGAAGGSKVTVVLDEPASAGDRVFRVRNAALAAAAARTFSEMDSASVPVDFGVRLVAGEPAVVTVRHASGAEGRARGAVVEPARTRAVDAHDVIEHVGRLGGSGFSGAGFDVSLSPGVGIGFSELHRLRREALDELRRELLEPWSGRAVTAASPPAVPAHAPRGNVEIVAVVSGFEDALACLEAGADRAHVAGHAPVRDVSPRIARVLPRIAHASEDDSLVAALRGSESVVASTLGQVVEAAARGAVVEGHWSLNATNEYAVAELADAGAGFVWLSPELSRDQIAHVARRSAVPVGISVLGAQELMVTEHCILMSEGPCDGACATCARRTQMRELVDRKGYRFPVRTDVHGRSHLYNAVPLDLVGSLSDVVATGVSAVRLDLELLGREDAVAAVGRVRAALSAGADGVAPAARASVEAGAATRPKTTTAGHFYRGVE